MLRRKAIVFLVLSLVLLFLGLWSLQLQDNPVSVVVARRNVKPWVLLTESDLAVRQVPHKYTAPDVIASPQQLFGKALALPVPAGAPISQYLVYTGPGVSDGERTWEIKHSGSVFIDSGVQPGDRVDIFKAVVNGNQQSVLPVVADVRVLAVIRTDRELRVTLAVTSGQAQGLMEAENFARQMRVVRSPTAWSPTTGGTP